MILQAVLLGLVAFVAQSEYALGTSLLSRPIVTGLFTGIVLSTRLGIKHFRLTGGEPLLHPQLDEMVLQIKKIPGVSSVSLTTNAVLLVQHAKWLKEAGIDSINVSLDTIDASEYERITKKPLLEEVKHGINAAIECGIRGVKNSAKSFLVI